MIPASRIRQLFMWQGTYRFDAILAASDVSDLRSAPVKPGVLWARSTRLTSTDTGIELVKLSSILRKKNHIYAPL